MNTEAREHKPQANATSALECNICYDDSYEPVTTTCGHIYCWSCIYQWMSSKADNNYCPVCKNVIAQDKLIPIYAKTEAGANKKAKHENIPKRPQSKREERPEQPNHNNNHSQGQRGFRMGGLFNGLFYGFNINAPNMVINVGFLPTLIPMILMFLFSLLSSSSDNTQNVMYQDESVLHHRSASRHINSMPMEVDENDYLEKNVIIFIFIFIALSCFIRRIMS
jgi:E3 ubiquitin-protein ligase RNF5